MNESHQKKMSSITHCEVSKSSDIPFHGLVAASSCGAMLVSLLMTPLDVIKVRLQAQQKPILPGNCFIYCNGLMDHLCPCFNGNGKPMNPIPWFRRTGHYNGSLDAVVKITRSEGLRSLWSGLSPTLLMAIPQTVIYFTLNESIKLKSLSLLHSDWHYWVPPIVGGISRVVALAVISPLEIIRIKKQSNKMNYSQVKEYITTSIRQSGYRSLWLGMGPSLLRDVPFSMLFWFIYDNLKFRYQTNHHQAKGSELNISHALLYSSFAGMISGVLTLPFDVIKTHRQIELGEAQFFNKPSQSSTLSLLTDLYRKRGIRSLFAGFTPRLIKVTPACAVMIGTFETVKSHFRKVGSN